MTAIVYTVSSAFRQAQLVATGSDPGPRHQIDAKELSEALRSRMAPFLVEQAGQWRFTLECEDTWVPGILAAIADKEEAIAQELAELRTVFTKAIQDPACDWIENRYTDPQRQMPEDLAALRAQAIAAVHDRADKAKAAASFQALSAFEQELASWQPDAGDRLPYFPPVGAWREADPARFDQLARQYQDAVAAQERRQAEAKLARDKAALDLRRRWLDLYGTKSQRERDNEGLLPAGEYQTALEDLAFHELRDRWLKYQGLTGADIEHGPDCGYPDVGYSSSAAKDATAGEHAQLAEVRDLAAVLGKHELFAVGAVEIQLREHTGRCDGCGAAATRKGIRIRLDLPGVRLSCELEIDEQEGGAA